MKYSYILVRVFAPIINLFVSFVNLFINRDKQIVLFGSWMGERYSDNPRFFFQFINNHLDEYKIKKAIWVGLLEGRTATVHPDFVGNMGSAITTGESVVVDGNIITGQGLGATIPFSLKLVEVLVGVETADKIKNAICYRT